MVNIMQRFLGLFIGAALAAVISAYIFRDDTAPDGWFVPTSDDKLIWMTRKQYEIERIHSTPRVSVLVKYYLYTPENPYYPEELYLDDVDSLRRSHFNKSYPTRFVVHGWRHDSSSEINVTIRRALLKVGKYNVIILDWSSESKNLNYITSKGVVPLVGENLAAFIDYLNEESEMPLENVTLIGHSLGAHVCGFAGKYVKRGRVGVITGLDPAYPLYDYSNCDTRLCSTDAEFVDSIHTNGQLLGFLEPIGTAAYYPNGGRYQPGCSIDLAGYCSHIRSFMYYAEALVRNNFKAIKCSDYHAAVLRNCTESFGNKKMGSSIGSFNEGCFFVPVNSKPLYGTG